MILLDEAGVPVGQARRATVHTTDTPLHLAFSCHLYRPDGRVLVTRRALSKKTWPGVWTNSFCGHPRVGEEMTEAIARHAQHELGLAVRDVEVILPNFRYRAVDASGVVENEVCPVFRAVTDDAAEPNPEEVAEHHWVDPEDLATAVGAAPWAFSPWLVAQLRELAG